MLLPPFSCAPKAARAGKGDHNIGSKKGALVRFKVIRSKPGFPGFDTTLTCQTLPGLNMRTVCQASKTAFRSRCARPVRISSRAHAGLTGLTREQLEQRSVGMVGNCLTGDARLEYLRNSGHAPEMREH